MPLTPSQQMLGEAWMEGPLGEAKLAEQSAEFHVERTGEDQYTITNINNPEEQYMWKPGANLPAHVMVALINYLHSLEPVDDYMTEEEQIQYEADRDTYYSQEPRVSKRAPSWVQDVQRNVGMGRGYGMYERPRWWDDPRVQEQMYLRSMGLPFMNLDTEQVIYPEEQTQTSQAASDSTSRTPRSFSNVVPRSAVTSLPAPRPTAVTPEGRDAYVIGGKVIDKALFHDW